MLQINYVFLHRSALRKIKHVGPLKFHRLLSALVQNTYPNRQMITSTIEVIV